MIQGIHKYNQEEHRFMNQLSDPIAVFDSGMGGISVLREMTKLMPNEDFIYYGDSKHAPYGTKTLEEVRALTNILHILLRKNMQRPLLLPATLQPVPQYEFFGICIPTYL